jgi:hypothetical protein
MLNHCALIGDIRRSRDLKNWNDIFGNLRETLQEVNRRFADDILVPFEPTVGDEFQGALKNSDHAYDVYTFIKASLPVHVYFGMGLGEVENPEQGNRGGLRGTAFYRARAALEKCKDEGGSLRLISAAASLQDGLINAVLRLIESHECDWTHRQKEVVNHVRKHPDQTHDKIAAHFGVARPTITKILKVTHYPVIVEAEKAVRETLKSLSQSVSSR